jgi:hypothetical protein
MWLWGLFLILAGSVVALHRRGKRIGAGILALFALCTAALAVSIFYGCYRYAPHSMGLPATTDAAGLTTFMCLSRDAFGTATGWTIFVLCCSAAAAFISLARPRGKSTLFRASLYIAAAIALFLACAGGFLMFFGYSWCLSERLF